MNKYTRYILLIIGILAMTLSNGKYLMAPAAFAFPLLFLGAFDPDKFLKSALLLILGAAIGNGMSFYGMLPDVGMAFLDMLPFTAGALAAVPFILQMQAFRKSNSFWATLILPSTFALMDFANANFNPFGGFGLLGYSQHSFLIFVQTASLVGALGLTFLIMWFGSTVYWLYKNGKLFKKNKEMLVFAGVLVIIFAYGTVRLNLEPDSGTIQVSGLHTLDRTVDETAALFADYENSPDRFSQKSVDNLEKIIEMTRAEAQGGADIVNHAEATIVVAGQGKDHAIKRLSQTAKEENIILVTAMYVLNPLPEKNENVLYIIDENGATLLSHYKYGGNAFEGSVEGDKVLHKAQTSAGTLSGIICWDKDFPTVVSQLGPLNIDTLFIPSADWKEISPYHSIVGTFRGLENGANVVTQTVNGMSMIVDYKGRVISEMDHFENTQWINRGQLPARGVKTVYAYIGTYVGYILLIILALAVILVKGTARPKK